MTEEPTPRDMEPVLKRYLEIQEQEQRLKEEKSELQSRLADAMQSADRTKWYAEVDGRKLKVWRRESVKVEYNEDLLKQRLGDRYAALLAPDIGKIRRNLDDIAPHLEPVMDRIGSPTPEKVKSAIASGQVQQEEFAGAFEKTVRRLITVQKAPPNRE